MNKRSDCWLLWKIPEDDWLIVLIISVQCTILRQLNIKGRRGEEEFCSTNVYDDKNSQETIIKCS